MQRAVRRLAVLAGLAAAVLIPTSAMGSSSSTGPQHFTVAFSNPSGLPANVDQLVRAAGGTIVERLPQIGGIGVVSSNPNFAAAMAQNASVKAADLSAQDGLIDPPSDASATDNGGTYSPGGPDTQPMPDSLGSEQWNMKQVNATLTGSYAVQRGRKDVRVFVMDTGTDQTHPDIAPNLDVADSRTFVTDNPLDASTIQDFNGHGTWTMSAVGAPINGVGVSGVAPNVTLIEGKVLDATGTGLYLWMDQALVYAGLQHFDVASASVGGYIPKCGATKSKPDACDHPDFILLNRATQFARANGVLPVAAAGNDGIDISDGGIFNDTTEAPGEIAGWVTVSATGYSPDGNAIPKAFYSNYGTSIDVSAPGGSTRDYRGIPGDPGVCPHGSLCRLIGAFSSTGDRSELAEDPIEQCTTGPAPVCGEYGYEQGTSMATPVVSGVAALIISQYGDFSGNNQNKPHMSPTAVESILERTANNQPCPSPNTVTEGPGFVVPTATCQGGTGNNTFFGKGVVDALKAVTFQG
jgi:subtilisin family serine protease